MDTHSQSHVCSGGHRHTQRCSDIHIRRSTPRETVRQAQRQTDTHNQTWSHAMQTNTHTLTSLAQSYLGSSPPPGSLPPSQKLPYPGLEAQPPPQMQSPFSSPLHPGSPPAPRPAGAPTLPTPGSRSSPRSSCSHSLPPFCPRP